VYSSLKCQHEGCNGELIYREDMEAKGRFGVFMCNSCGCTFSLVNVRRTENCPSVKSEKKKPKEKIVGTTDVISNKEDYEKTFGLPLPKDGEFISQMSTKRGRGRPKGSKNKK